MAASDIFTLAQLADQVAHNLGSLDDITEAKCKLYVNRALMRFSEMGDFSWMRVYQQYFNTVIGQEKYVLPGVKKLESIYLSSPIQRRLTLLEDRRFRQLYPNNTATGQPYYYREMGWYNAAAVDSLQIGLYPIPDTVVTVKYDCVAAMTLMANDTDDVRKITNMPTHMVDLVIEMATAIGWKELDDADAQTQMNECIKRLSSAYQEDQYSLDDRLIMAPLDNYDFDKFMDPTLGPNFSD